MRLFVLLAALAAGLGYATGAQAATPPMCGGMAGRPVAVTHVVVIVLENHSYGQIVGPAGSTAARQSPFVNGTVARRCGLATNSHAITHPSLPNYLAITAGTNGGISSDCTGCWTSAHNIFGQLGGSGRSWRAYQESMPRTCDRSNYGLYAKRHNPPTYFRGLVARCPAWDVPLGSFASGRFATAVRHGWLPAYSFVTPNLCHDTHDCPIHTGDDWLRQWVPLITNSTGYRAGRTVVFITWDEGAGGFARESCALHPRDQSCHIPTFVLSAYTRPGTRSAVRYTHWSLLKASETLLHLPLLAHAGDLATLSLRPAFGLG
jgi:phosphatidylinositol-3-phosphatase